MMIRRHPCQTLLTTLRGPATFFAAVLALLLPPSASASSCEVPGTDYTFSVINWALNDAARSLQTCSRTNWQPCRAADKALDRADVAIDQILRECTMNNCIKDKNEMKRLERDAGRLAGLSRSLVNQSGMRRTYDNSLGKIRSWSGTRLCSAAGGGGSGCKQIVGQWKWFNCGVVTFYDNGTMKQVCNNKLYNSGTWRCVNPSTGAVQLRWSKGGWVDNLNVSGNGQQLSGRNQAGGAVSASKQGGGGGDCNSTGYNPYGCN